MLYCHAKIYAAWTALYMLVPAKTGTNEMQEGVSQKAERGVSTSPVLAKTVAFASQWFRRTQRGESVVAILRTFRQFSLKLVLGYPVLEVSENPPREGKFHQDTGRMPDPCFLCGETATVAYHSCSDGPNYFCSSCNIFFHKRSDRAKHEREFFSFH